MRRLGEVDAEGLHRPATAHQAPVQLGLVRQILGLRDANHETRQFDVSGQTVHDPVETDEDRSLQQDREAPAGRIDLVPFVELHHLLVHGLTIAAVLFLKLLDLGLQLGHALH